MMGLLTFRSFTETTMATWGGINLGGALQPLLLVFTLVLPCKGFQREISVLTADPPWPTPVEMVLPFIPIQVLLGTDVKEKDFNPPFGLIDYQRKQLGSKSAR